MIFGLTHVCIVMYSAHILCCGLLYDTYIGISPYYTLCCGLHYDTYIGISPYHTLCCGFHYDTYIGISPYHTLCCGLHYDTYIGISPYHTLCCGFHYDTYIGISPYHTLCCGFHYDTYIGISPYHTLCCGFHYDTYIGISPYHTLAVDPAKWQICHVWLDRVRKYKRWSFFVWYEKIQHTCSMNKVFTPYSLNECFFFPYRTQMNTVCIFYNQSKVNETRVMMGVHRAGGGGGVGS